MSSELALLDAVAAPVLAVGDDRRVRYVNAAARRVFGDGIVGEPIDRAFREPGAWDLCLVTGSIEAELVAANDLPIRASVHTAASGDLTLATLMIHEVRELLAGLTHILGTSGGDLGVLFDQLTPLFGDRIPYRRCSLAIWHRDLQQVEMFSHHPGDDGSHDQRGEMIDDHKYAELIESIKDRYQPILRQLKPAQRALIYQLSGVEVGPVCHLPLHHDKRLLGVLTLSRGAGESFQGAELRHMRPLIGTLSLGVEVALLIRDLKEREERVRAANAVTLSLGPDGIIQEAGSGAWGYSVDELIGTPLVSLLAPASAEQLARALGDLDSSRIAFQGEREIIRKDGAKISVHVDSAVQLHEGKPGRIRVAVREIAEAREMQEQRLQAQKLKSLGRMISGITHQFNNLLGPILGYAQLLQRRPGGEAMARELGQIEGAAQKARAILDSMLRFARQSKPDKRYQDLGDVLESAVSLIAGRARKQGIEIQLNRGHEIPWTRVDADQMTQLFLNLFHNSIEASGDQPGTIRVDIYPQGMWLQVVVLDDAGGIDEAILPHLFDPFAGAGTSGTGMGLATCFGIVTDHGGSIQGGNSTLDGKPGARFEILLPVRRRPTETVKRFRKFPPAERPDLAGKRVLVAEDDTSYNAMICGLIEDLGAEVDSVADGAEASDRLHEGEYHMVVADIRMPRMDGGALYEWIGANRPDLAGRVMLVTGDTLDDETRRLAEQLGQRLVAKPFEVDDFYLRLSELLG